MLPLDYETDREIFEAAFAGRRDLQAARILWIANTLELGEVECSAAFLAEAQTRNDLEILTPLRSMPWDAAGSLPEMRELS
jgi:hypothetical protein